MEVEEGGVGALDAVALDLGGPVEIAQAALLPDDATGQRWHGQAVEAEPGAHRSRCDVGGQRLGSSRADAEHGSGQSQAECWSEELRHGRPPWPICRATR